MNIKRLIGLVCALVLWCIAGVVLSASAEAPDQADGSLTLWCVKNDDIISGMKWHLYRVGHREKDDYVFEGEFADYRVTLGDKRKPMLEWNAETVADAGNTLKIKCLTDHIPARADGSTDSQGSVRFSGLENGLYLVWGETLRKGDTTYIPSAIFFEINDTTEASLNAYPKIVLRILSDGDRRYSVRKVWENDENQPLDRAVSITVERYRDNELYDEVVLSEENDWTFAWYDTDEHSWFVHEKIIPPHYTVSYKDNQTQYLIVNTYTGETKEVTTTSAVTTSSAVTTASAVTESTAAETTGSSIFVTTGTVTQTSDTTTGSTAPTQIITAAVTTAINKVPQTGQLWWPVPGLAGGGLVLLGIGAALRKKDEDE